jgi:hypothetical protein
LQRGLWICRYKAEPTVAYISSDDRSDALFTCKRVDDIPSELRAAYWLYKSFKWIESLPPW